MLERAWRTCPKALPEALHMLRGPYTLGLWAWCPLYSLEGRAWHEGRGTSSAPGNPLFQGLHRAGPGLLGPCPFLPPQAPSTTASTDKNENLLRLLVSI